jgi:hypothetical protein
MDLNKVTKSSSNGWLFISAPASRAPTPELDWDQCSTVESWELRPINPNEQASIVRGTIQNAKPVAMVSSPRPPTPSHHFYNLPLQTEDEVKIQTLIKDLAEKKLFRVSGERYSP